ncbi:MAG: hypothetical protein GXY38_06450 [Planctomycetes bacterium]|nr:hypothetical protein [Planctomycetota bacterium]
MHTQSVFKHQFREAQWIWDDSQPRGYHYYLRARRAFTLESADVTHSYLYITADSMYQVWLNGHIVGHGPSKSAGGIRFVDCYDVTPLLDAHENNLEVLVLGIGTSTMSYCAGDWVQQCVNLPSLSRAAGL